MLAHMLYSKILLLVVAPLVAGMVLEHRQTNTTTISSTVERGINTECKRCPFSLCPNTLAFESGDSVTLACWTEGTDVNNDTTWLGTSDGCYITQWDLVEYAGDYHNDLPYCGAIPETHTTGGVATYYYTECNIVPDYGRILAQADHIKMYKPEVDLTLTCYADNGGPVLGNTRWYKTVSNCYVPEAQIEPIDKTILLDDCGPVPFLELKMREPDLEPALEVSTLWPSRPVHSKLSRRWLYNTRIGEDEADCTEDADAQSSVVRTIPFGRYINVQCATFGPNDERQIYLLTTDFCWVNDTLTDPMLVDDSVRASNYPDCIEFVDEET